MSRNLSFLFSFLIQLSIVTLPLSANAGTPTVYVDPPSKTVLLIGETFPVNVTVTNVSLLCAWEFQICYNSGILNASNWTPGPVFTSPGVLIFNQSWTDNYNATHGLIHIVCTLVGQGMFSGTTTLATVYFKVKSYGTTVLHLQNTSLLDNSSPFPLEIPHTTADGTVYAGSTSHELAVTNVTPEKTVVGLGYLTRINVTVANSGNVNETFNITLKNDTTTVGAQTVYNLPNGSSTTLTLVWNTTGFSYGNYTVTAYATPVPGETHIEDNTLTSTVPVMIGMPGDVVSPFGVIDMKDIGTVAKRFGTTPSAPLWDSNADIDGSGKVDMKDIGTVAKNFGKRYP